MQYMTPTQIEKQIQKNSRLIERKMADEGLSKTLIKQFELFYAELLSGKVGYLPENDLEPVATLPAISDISEEERQLGNNSSDQVVTIKLNGGLGTSMGLRHAKSILPLRGSLTFLNIIAHQSLYYRIPLLLMNSFNTHDDTVRSLQNYRGLNNELPVHFMCNKIPKISAIDFGPASYPKEPALEWCPPGHGDFYLAIHETGVLEILLQKGYKYAFISNADNLGAVFDPGILGHLIRNDLDFLMEVVERNPIDKKGGHLASRDKRLILREAVQCPPQDKSFFEDIHRHRFFNTNNIWMNLKSLQKLLNESQGLLQLPLIINKKHIDPADRKSPEIYQLETAIGAAVSIFNLAGALHVPRMRFAPVKNTNDLLIIRSDYYHLFENYQLRPSPERSHEAIDIDLDPHFYRSIQDFDLRFPYGVPSLKNCRSLKVRGDVHWGKNTRLEGDAIVTNQATHPQTVPSGATLSGKLSW
jgi:UTP--glucose-1-phosphate uridylyltransferase